MDEKVAGCLYAAIDEVNRQRDGKEPVAKSAETAIHGSASSFDSLDLVNFIAAAEENVERVFGRPIMLADDRALTREPSPFQSVGVLGEYVEELLQEQG